MNRKSVVIIDDEPDARMLLRQYTNAYSNIDIVAECSDGHQAISVIDRLKPDWAFVDIQMPKVDGFKVLQSITYIPQIVFSTAYDNFALAAFEQNAVDYLLKPYSWVRFSRAINKLMNDGNTNHQSLQLLDYLLMNQAQNEQRFFVNNGKKMIAVKAGEVLLLEASDDYTKIHTKEKIYLSHNGISILEQRLDPGIFIRIHRSYIVNVHQVSEAYRNADGIYVKLAHGTTVKVSRSYQDNIRRLFL